MIWWVWPGCSLGAQPFVPNNPGLCAGLPVARAVKPWFKDFKIFLIPSLMRHPLLKAGGKGPSGLQHMCLHCKISKYSRELPVPRISFSHKLRDIVWLLFLEFAHTRGTGIANHPRQNWTCTTAPLKPENIPSTGVGVWAPHQGHCSFWNLHWCTMEYWIFPILLLLLWFPDWKESLQRSVEKEGPSQLLITLKLGVSKEML